MLRDNKSNISQKQLKFIFVVVAFDSFSSSCFLMAIIEKRVICFIALHKSGGTKA